jgi:hypothetical protein
MLFSIHFTLSLENETESRPVRYDVVTNLMIVACFFLVISFLLWHQMLNLNICVV